MHRHALGLAQSGAIAAFLIMCPRVDAQTYAIAKLYTITVWGFLVVAAASFGIIRIDPSRVRRTQER